MHHLPQNRDVCAITGGGTLHLCRYKYPDQRKVKVRGAAGGSRARGALASVQRGAHQPVVAAPCAVWGCLRGQPPAPALPLLLCTRRCAVCGSQDQDGQELGVAGDMGEAVWKEVSSQPILGFDWSADKEGLFVCSALDQCLRVGIATKTNTL